MATITDVKRRIQELSPAPFQEFCDTLLHKIGYGKVHGYGMKAGTGQTTRGNPDTYFRKDNGKYVLVAYTTQQDRVFDKLKEDIEKCLDTTKTGLNNDDIEEIICCHTSSNLKAGDDKTLHQICKTKGIKLTILGIDEIANQVHNRYRSLVKDYLGLNIDTNQILSVGDFVAQYDANKMSAPLSIPFLYRETEKAEIVSALKTDTVVLVFGKAGVGKTRLVLETIEAFAQNEGYNLLCVKNNNLSIYDDLVCATEHEAKYLFFIDDANELADLRQILNYTTKRYLGFEVKVIVTVRDYAKARVISEIIEFCTPYTIGILPFSDKEIEGFIGANFQISNELYIQQIIRIAEGNPRIAYMAGRLAIEKENLSAIENVSELLDAYYEKFLAETIGADTELCVTVGILSVISAIVFSKVHIVQDILFKYGINIDRFETKIRQLASMEVVEIRMNQVATISDQCFANYMLYYVFFKTRIIPFSEILEIGYKYFRNGVLKGISTVLSIFHSEETKAYCQDEINKVWLSLEKSQDSCYEEFAKDFHIFRPETAFQIAIKKVNRIPNSEMDVFNIDFGRNAHFSEDDILGFLAGYQLSDYIGYVLEILLNYCSKQTETLISGYKWLENNYGIDPTSIRYGFYTQSLISEFLYKEILNGNSIAMSIGCQWSDYILGFEFHPTEMGRERNFIYYTLEMHYSEPLNKLRQICWGSLCKIANWNEWHHIILKVLDHYVWSLRRKPDAQIVKGDFACISTLLQIMNSNRISYLKVIDGLLYGAEQLSIEPNKEWYEKLTGDDWYLYKILVNDYATSNLDYEEYEEQRESKLIDFSTKLLDSKIDNWVKSLELILSQQEAGTDSYSINEGIEIIVQQFDIDRMHLFMKAFIRFGSNISINPSIVLVPLESKIGSESLFQILDETDFPQKNPWLFSFFDSLGVEQANYTMLNRLLSFFRSDSDKSVLSSTYRNLRLLDKFLNIEPNIYLICCSIIFDKREYSRFIVKIYFYKLFAGSTYSPKDLLVLFNSDLLFLQHIYFYMLKYEEGTDYDGVFLREFINFDDGLLKKYAEVFWEKMKNHDNYEYNRIYSLWYSQNYISIFDELLHSIPNGLSTLVISKAFRYILAQRGHDILLRKRQLEWLIHTVVDNARGERIELVFAIISELDEYVRREAIKTFLTVNPDFDTFCRLPLVPNNWVSFGSLIPSYQKQVDFLESLVPFMSGLRYLSHRETITKKIEAINKWIENEKLDEICRHLYM